MDSRPPNPHNIPLSVIPPDLLEWARQTLDLDEIMADIREIERTGGVTFEEIMADLEKLIEPDHDPAIIVTGCES